MLLAAGVMPAPAAGVGSVRGNMGGHGDCVTEAAAEAAVGGDL